MVKSTESKDTGKTYFSAIGEGRSSHGEKIDPFKVVILGVDVKETAAVAAQGEEEKAIAERGVMPGADEVSAFQKNPEWFMAEWPDEAERLHFRKLLEGVLTMGRNLQPIIAEKVGSHVVVCNGRHNAAAVRVGRRLMAGEIMVRQFNALVLRLREERGDKWVPDLIAQPPPKSAATGQTLDIADVAEMSQSIRLLTEEEWYERAMRRYRAQSAAEKVDYKSIAAAINGATEAKIKSWVTLSEMHAKVREYVLRGIPGTEEGGVRRRFPLTSAVTFASLPKVEQIAKVEAMIAAGDTRVSTAKNTARAATDAAAEKRDRAEAKGEKRANGGGEAPSDKDLVEAFSDALGGGEAKSEKEEKPAKQVARGQWGLADFKKFQKKHPSAVVKAIIALLTRGPDRLDGADLKAIPGLEEYLDGK